MPPDHKHDPPLHYRPVHRSTAGRSLRGRRSSITLLVALLALSGIAELVTPQAHAAPAPEAEYLYDVTIRRHYDFPNGDALRYGQQICDTVTQGNSYAQVMRIVKTDVTPNDEFASNYLISYAVNLLCPVSLWQLRNSAAGYQPPVEPSATGGP